MFIYQAEEAPSLHAPGFNDRRDSRNEGRGNLGALVTVYRPGHYGHCQDTHSTSLYYDLIPNHLHTSLFTWPGCTTMCVTDSFTVTHLVFGNMLFCVNIDGDQAQSTLWMSIRVWSDGEHRSSDKSTDGSSNQFDIIEFKQ